MKMSFKLKYLLLLISFVIPLLCGCMQMLDIYGGGKSYGNPDMMMAELSPEAKALITDAYALGGKDVVDYHVHIVAYGDKICDICPEIDTDGAYINKNRFSMLNAGLYIKTKALMSCSKVADQSEIGLQYTERLYNLAKNAPSNTKFHLLALDGYWEKRVGADGTEVPYFNEEMTDLFIPNKYVFQLAECLNRKIGSERFVPVISVHPYRPKSAEVLEEYYNKGVRYVKWIPNSMNIDPRIDDAEYTAFYKKMSELGMVLMSHTGWEGALHVVDDAHQNFGFPRYMESALNAGVKVVLAHSGGDDKLVVDGKTSNESFLEMIREAQDKPEWELYGDLSALTSDHNYPHLKGIIENSDQSGFTRQFIYGSDYPHPAAYLYYPVNDLISSGYLDENMRAPLKEIFKYNPLIFDFVLKRNIRHPKTGEKLPIETFFPFEERSSKMLTFKRQKK